MIGRVIRTLKEQCTHCHRFETRQHASRVIGDWIRFHNHQRPHQALKTYIGFELLLSAKSGRFFAKEFG